MLRDVPAIGRRLSEVVTEDVTLVRRRSGGGTVFHDYGNLNYCVICSVADFTRDKHAEMVTQAIRTIMPRARVNDRHDIVLDQGTSEIAKDKMDDSHQQTGATPASLKISGSAYKLTRQRALHHGTCLIASPNIGNISAYLRSPARPFMKARGVESVRSPIANIIREPAPGIETCLNDFQTRIIQSFANLYSIDQKVLEKLFYSRPDADADCCVGGYLGSEMSGITDIENGVAELQVRFQTSKLQSLLH